MAGLEYVKGGAIREVSRVQGAGRMFGGAVLSKDNGYACSFPAPGVRIVTQDGAYIFTRDEATLLADAIMDCVHDG